MKVETDHAGTEHRSFGWNPHAPVPQPVARSVPEPILEPVLEPDLQPEPEQTEPIETTEEALEPEQTQKKGKSWLSK